MKEILYHFRNSFVLGIVLIGSCICIPLANIRIIKADSVATNSNLTSPIPIDAEVVDSAVLPDNEFRFSTDLIIKAINPGYTINSIRDVGELIELQKITDATELSLAGYAVKYTNSSGNSTVLLDFSDGSLMTGETLLMRLARSPDSDRADATYMTTLAMSTGRIELLYQGAIVDQVCWGSQEGCMTSFKSANPTTLLRNLETGLFEHISDYEPTFDPELPSLILPPPTTDPNGASSDDTTETTARCYKLEFSEVFSYYAEQKSEQFIELYNPSDETVVLNQCYLRYKNKSYYLSGEIAPDSYYAYLPFEQTISFTLTKNPTSSNTIELIDANGSIVDTLVYNHGQKKSTSFARFYNDVGEEIWSQTYAPTPGTVNVYQEFRSCPEGKVINPDTGNCVKTTGSTTTVCPEGKYLNPLTGRCKKIEDSTSTLKECQPGYERNPETNRCRKVTSSNQGADYALIPNTSSSKSTFIALGSVILIAALGVTYIILQFRREITRTMRKIRQRIHHILKNLVTRHIGFHRKKDS